jgi:hypothetical protein
VAMPKLLFAFLVHLSAINTSLAHEFYFAHAEISYNELQQKLEGTLIFTTHDLERTLAPKGTLIGKFEKLDPRAPELLLLENYINQHFQITYGCALDSNAVDALCMSKFTLEGIVTQLNGTIECYISAAIPALYNPIQFKFDALMEQYPGQQNKLTFIYRNQKETLNFIPGKEIQNIPLKP